MTGEARVLTVPASPDLRDPRRRRSKPGQTLLLAAPIAVLSAASLAGNVLAPQLVSTHPLLLVSLSPRTVYLAIAAGDTPLAAFLAVGMLRLCAADPWHYRLGALHGDRLERVRAGMPSFCRQVALPVVALFPNGKVIVVAGAARLPHASVAVAAAAGTLVQLVTVYAAGRALAAPLQGLADVLSGSAVIVAAVTVVMTAVIGARAWRRRSRAEP